MTEVNHLPADAVPVVGEPVTVLDESDLLDETMPTTRAQKLRLVGLVILKRVRFIAILFAVGLFICKWDMVMNYWDKWTQSRSVASRDLEPGHEFYCPMDPQVVRSNYEPNGDVPKCPICGMPLSDRKKGEKVKLPAGVTARVQLSPERIQLAGIKTVAAEYRPMARQIKTVGYVAFDESRLSRIVSRVEGYVEKLYVDKTFAFVHEGDPLAEIYSPELYSTARELVLSSKGQGIDSIAASARNKLLLLGVSKEDIDRMIASGEPAKRVMIRSPQTGYVVAKKIVVGASFEAKMTLLEVADLSTVWVEADVYERDIPFLQVGQKIEATVEAVPNRTFTGKLASIYPQLETATRTNRVRFELDNPQHELRPGMFATVRINTPLESIEPYKSAAIKSGRMIPVSLRGSDKTPAYEFLAVPERAVIDTGSKKVVYVERTPGVFEGVEVELGPRQDDAFPVIRGLKPGDRVAAAGGFLIDAETRLNPAAAAAYFGASGGPQSNGSSGTLPAPSTRQRDDAPAGPSRPAEPAQGSPAPPQSDSSSDKVTSAGPDPDDLKNIQELPEADRKPALVQRICPVTGQQLGSMGVPVKITLRGKPVYLCCKGCMGKALRNPDEMLKKLAEAASSGKQP
jgi:membrane fusion protein, copper/silver efflux system